MGESPGESESWMVEALQKLRERNRVQVEPFVAVYQSHSKLWYENAQLRSLQRDLRHQVASLQHETADMLSSITTAKQDPTIASALAEKLKSSLSLIQNELKSKLNFDSDRRSRIDLSKKVRDQQKLLADQQEELIVAKQELGASHEKLSLVDAEMKKDKASLDAVRAELESVRALVSNAEEKARKFEVENGQLVMRILREKEKAAEEFNKMVQSADGEFSFFL
jgi:DNA repair exonuclease SbcCD ATPase subunit